MDKPIQYIYRLEMDNEKSEKCAVLARFLVNEDSSFDGFMTISSAGGCLYSEDLAHLEEWVVQGKQKWIRANVRPPVAKKEKS